MSGKYSLTKRRWLFRPATLRWSQMVLGRRATQKQLLDVGVATVSCYRVKDGRLFYTDPVTEGSKPGPRVLYRIRVRLKPIKLENLDD